jgi:hypothetical protein
MTQEQKSKIEHYREQFGKKCSDYSGWSGAKDCRFELYESDKEEDKNITIYSSYISGLSDDYQPYYDIINLLIEEDGNVVDLSTILTSNERIDYINTLTKINVE